MLEAIQNFSSTYSPIDFWLIASEWRLFLSGFVNTVALFTLTTAAGAILAIPLGIIRAEKVPVLSPIVFVYSYLFRGTPLLVQTYMLYFGAGEFDFIKNSLAWNVLSEPWWCAFIAFSLNTAAYVTEIVRSGMEAIPSGEVEAAKACGMLPAQRLKRIILPSAFRRALPMYSNEVIFALHGTVVASTITIIDVLGAGRTLNGMYYLAYEGFVTAALIYGLIAVTVTKVFRVLERHFNKHLRPRQA